MKRIISYAVAAITVFLFVGEPGAQNVGQEDFPAQGCAQPPDPTDIVPNFQIILETSGQPVLVSYVIRMGSSPQGVLQSAVYIDGVRDTAHVAQRNIGDFLASGQTDTISALRVYDLPKGVHIFELGVSCAKAVQIAGWMTVYELPKQGHRGGH